MVRAPFQITPLVFDTLAVLVKSRKRLSSREIAERLPERNHTYIVKALGRMHTTGWVTCESTPRPGSPAVMGYSLEKSVRTQAAAIINPKRKSTANPPPPVPEPLGLISWRSPRIQIAEAILNSDTPMSPSRVATQIQFPQARVLKALHRLEAEGVVEADRPYDPMVLLPERTFTITADTRDIVTERVERWHREHPYWTPGAPRPMQPGAHHPHTDYLSTACRHEVHKHCRSNTAADGASKEPGTCKFCDAKCICWCHSWNY